MKYNSHPTTHEISITQYTTGPISCSETQSFIMSMGCEKLKNQTKLSIHAGNMVSIRFLMQRGKYDVQMELNIVRLQKGGMICEAVN